MIAKDSQYYKFCAYGFLKNLRFFDPFLILFLRECGLTFLEIGTLFSIREITRFALEIPSGYVADQMGRKSAMIFAFGAYIVSFAMFYVFSSYHIFIFAMLFYAAGESFRSGTHKAMIFGYLQRTDRLAGKTDYYGHTRSWSQIGSALSALIAGALVFYSGEYRIVFLVSMAPYLAGLVLIASYPKELNFSAIDHKAGEKTKLSEILLFIKRGNYRSSILNSCLYDALFKTIKEYLQPIIKTFAIGLPVLISVTSRQRIPIVTALIYFSLFLFSSYASRRSASVAGFFKNPIMALNLSFVLGILLTFCSGLGYFHGFHLIAILLFMLLYGMQNVRRPINVSVISENIPDQLMATGLSVETQLKAILIGLLSPLLGFCADVFGVGAAIMIVAVLLILLYPLARIKLT